MNSLRNRILVFFTFFAFVAATAIYMSGRSTQIIGEAASAIAQRHLPMVQAVSELEVALYRLDDAVYRYVGTGQKQWRDAGERERNNYTRWLLKAQEMANTDEDLRLLQEVDELYIQYDNQTRYVLLSKNRNSSDMFRSLETADQYLEQIQIRIDEMEAMRTGMTIVLQQQIYSTLNRHKQVAVIFLLMLALTFVALAFYLVQYLVRPLGLLQKAIRDFTRGKSDVVIPPIGKDELGELQEAFNEMSRELMVERKRLKAESQSDALTGLFNMRYFRSQFIEEYSRSQRYGRPLTVLMIDVDFFKKYNDRNGHPAGDIVLKEIARILIRNVRGTDLVARYGGEEFVILLPETPLESAITVSEKIRKTVETHHFPFRDSVTNEKLSVSIGLASYPESHISSDQELIETADKALYEAKKSGRNRVCLFVDGQYQEAAAYKKPLVSPK